MIIQPKVRGFICTTAHPDGCEAHVREQASYVKSMPVIQGGPRNVLIIGASTGYGLASRIVSMVGCGAGTVNVYFERPGTEKKTASPGYYNSVAADKLAAELGLYAKSFDGDAFSDELKQQVVEELSTAGKLVDLVVYSLASPRRTDPRNGETYRSVLKPIGAPFVAKNLNTDKGEIEDITIEPATEIEIAETVKVMGGEDWERWIDALMAGGVLAQGAITVAYSYIGPEVTWPVYRDGTIGAAKNDLDETAHRLNDRLQNEIGACAMVSVNKAVVTQASSAIPVVPLYLSILLKEMRSRGLHEGCIEQIHRLFSQHLYHGHEQAPVRDEKNRIRIDDWEMREDVQAAVKEIWPKITTESLAELSDFSGYQSEFLKLFGFGLPSVNYDLEVDPVR